MHCTQLMKHVLVSAFLLFLLPNKSEEKIVAQSLSSKKSAIGPGTHKRIFQFGGLNRHYLFHIPPKFNPNKKSAIVLVLHGGASNAKDWEKFCGMDKTADKYNFIVVFPNGTGRIKGYEEVVCTWNAGPRAPGGTDSIISKIDDVGFISKVLDDLSSVVKVDTSRVYAAGMSMGGIMSYRLASELSNRIAAIASISGSMGTEDLGAIRPVSIMQIHGNEDQAVPFDGGKGKLDVTNADFLSVQYSIDKWVKENGCSTVPVVDTLPDKDNDSTRVVRKQWLHGKDKTEVVLLVVEGGGHTWPSRPFGPELKVLGRTSTDISANEMIWKFFEQHSLK